MRLATLELRDFRNHTATTLEPAGGLTALVGGNGQGKTAVLEAVGYLATLTSFRGAPGAALVRTGASSAVVRAEVVRDGDDGTSDAVGDRSASRATVRIEAELRAEGRDRVLVNRAPLRRARDLLGTLRVSVFAPDDLALVRGGPGERRRLLDEVLVALVPRHAGTLDDLERVLRQRGALLKQVAGTRADRLSAEVVATLEVWDAKLAAVGDALGRGRARLVERLEPEVGKAYDRVAATAVGVAVTYEAPWREGGLAAALAAARDDDLRRGTTTVGPHRDELGIALGGLGVRTHASSGEQRSLALALRLGAHDLVAEVTGTAPVLLLDDVFSELDPDRCAALLAALPDAQALLTTAGPLPSGTEPDLVLRVRDGALVPR